MTANTLYYGDNLDILRRYGKDETVDLVYLDPPFNSKRDYNATFTDEHGSSSAAQVQAFQDTWSWNADAAHAWQEMVEHGSDSVSRAMQAFRTLLGDNGYLAYLSMMAPRLVELRRVMKTTASIYLHCDQTMSAHLRLLMNAVFGAENFRNEIIWKRSNPKSHSTLNFPNCIDTILRYSKTEKFVFFPQFGVHDDEYVETAYRHEDEKGRYRLLPLLNPNDDRPNLTYEFLGVTRVWRWTKERMTKALAEGIIVQTRPGAVPQYKKYLSESKGKTVTNCWTDIQQASGNEALGYPTQKPEALLERIIQASSKEGDVVLDPFCGCGTAVAVAEKLKRRWMGIDLTHLAVNLIRTRLKDTFGAAAAFKVVGEPEDLAGAQALADLDKYQFQFWALGLVGARPAAQDEKKGADGGIDGRLYFHDEVRGSTKQVIISVKGGKSIPANAVRDLLGTVEREKAAIGVLISIAEPTRSMREFAASAGFYDSKGFNRRYPKIQLLTVADLFNGKNAEYPSQNVTFKQAPRASAQESDTTNRLFGEV